jgi:hypothetical protein
LGVLVAFVYAVFAVFHKFWEILQKLGPQGLMIWLLLKSFGSYQLQIISAYIRWVIEKIASSRPRIEQKEEREMR